MDYKRFTPKMKASIQHHMQSNNYPHVFNLIKQGYPYQELLNQATLTALETDSISPLQALIIYGKANKYPINSMFKECINLALANSSSKTVQIKVISFLILEAKEYQKPLLTDLIDQILEQRLVELLNVLAPALLRHDIIEDDHYRKAFPIPGQVRYDIFREMLQINPIVPIDVIESIIRQSDSNLTALLAEYSVPLSSSQCDLLEKLIRDTI